MSFNVFEKFENDKYARETTAVAPTVAESGAWRFQAPQQWGSRIRVVESGFRPPNQAA